VPLLLLVNALASFNTEITGLFGINVTGVGSFSILSFGLPLPFASTIVPLSDSSLVTPVPVELLAAVTAVLLNVRRLLVFRLTFTTKVIVSRWYLLPKPLALGVTKLV
jgi:hypothetical protein